MEKIEKLFDSAWGVVIFYLVVALVSFMMVTSISNSNVKVSNLSEENVSYYA